MIDKLIILLGGYTHSEVVAVKQRKFKDFKEAFYLSGFLEEGEEFQIMDKESGGVFVKRSLKDPLNKEGIKVKY